TTQDDAVRSTCPPPETRILFSREPLASATPTLARGSRLNAAGIAAALQGALRNSAGPPAPAHRSTTPAGAYRERRSHAAARPPRTGPDARPPLQSSDGSPAAYRAGPS